MIRYDVEGIVDGVGRRRHVIKAFKPHLAEKKFRKAYAGYDVSIIFVRKIR